MTLTLNQPEVMTAKRLLDDDDAEEMSVEEELLALQRIRLVHMSCLYFACHLFRQPASHPSTHPSIHLTVPNHIHPHLGTWDDRGVLADRGLFLESDFPGLFDDDDEEGDETEQPR